MKRFVAILITLFLSGCAATGYQTGHHQILELQLKQPITVPAGKSSVFIKAPGQVVSRNHIDTYEVYCKFAVPRSRDSGELVIAPDVFTINSIYRRVSSLYPQPYQFQLASYGSHGFGGLFRHHDASKQDLELFLSLSSVNQPNVKSLSCIRFADPYFGYRPTITDMKQVLGGLAEFTEAY